MPKASKIGSFRKAAAADAEATRQKRSIRDANQGGEKADGEESRLLFVEDLSSANNKNEDDKTSNKNTTSRTTAPSTLIDIDATTNDSTALSRGQRKRLAKQKQYQRKQEMILTSLKLQKKEEQRKRIDGLNAIKEALLATVQPKPKNDDGDDADNAEDIVAVKPNLLKTNKTKELLVQKEAAQLSLVIQHPSFQADPFATIREHLKNTLAPDAAVQQRQAAKRLQDQRQSSSSNSSKKSNTKNKIAAASSSASSPFFKKKRKQRRARPTRSRGSKNK
ncbi:hypothetical protein ACA910_006103 [Epithemia clementina (nom. ined.)]